MNDVVIKVIKAFQPGDTVFIELDRPTSAAQVERMRSDLRDVIKESGIKIILLDHGMRIASREEIIERNARGNGGAGG